MRNELVKMVNKNEVLRKLLASWVDYQVIRGNSSSIPDEPDFAVFRSLPAETVTTNDIRVIEDKEYSSRLIMGAFQLDFYSDSQVKAEEMAHGMVEKIIFSKRNDLVRAGFGVSDYQIEVDDRTFIENSEFIYRYGFDVKINYRTITERENTPIEHIDITIGDENKEI